MKKIPLTQGQFALVDDEDYELLSGFKWSAHRKKKSYYAVRCPVVNGKQIMVQMHRVILGLVNPKQLVDHADGNGLNNCRSNLRLCNYSENGRNQGKQRNNTSGFKGVTWNKNRNNWRVSIRANGKRIYLGSFADLNSAAKAYNDAAESHHGQFARLNTIL